MALIGNTGVAGDSVAEEAKLEPKSSESESDDDEGPIVLKKASRVRRSILEDENDKPAISGYNAGVTESAVEFDEPIKKAAWKKRRIVRPVAESDSSEDEGCPWREGDADPVRGMGAATEERQGSAAAVQDEVEDNDEEVLRGSEEPSVPCEAAGSRLSFEPDEEEEGDSGNWQKSLLANDLFDNEGSDEADGASDEKEKSTKQKGRRSNRTKQNSLQQLHSESQRLVRESAVRLPYHVPQPKTLEEFLGRFKAIPTSLKPTLPQLTHLKVSTGTDVVSAGVCRPNDDAVVLHALITAKEIASNNSELQPRLSGGPLQEIVLDEEEMDCNDGVSKLIERFVKHTSLNKTPNIVHTEGYERPAHIPVRIKSAVCPENSPTDFRLKLRVQLARKRAEIRKEKFLLCEVDDKESDLESEAETEEEEDKDVVTGDDMTNDEQKTVDSSSDAGSCDENTSRIADGIADKTLTSSAALFSASGEANDSLNQDQPCNESLDSSLELIGSLLPAYQPGGGFRNRNKKIGYFGDFEESCKFSQDSDVRDGEISQTTRYKFDDELYQSRLKTEHNGSFAYLGTQGKSEENMDELLDLCSGQWPERVDSVSDSAQSRKVEDLTSHDSDDELPCMPASVASNDETTRMPKECSYMARTRTETAASDDDDDSMSSLESFNCLPRRNQKRAKRILSDSEVSDCLFEGGSESEAEIAAVKEVSQRLAIHEYFDKEAELSGSDASSDEDEVPGEDDVLEEEFGDEDCVSDEEIRKQNDKIHQKLQMDEDQRMIRIYKELYLENGEFHVEGRGRMRSFRWLHTKGSTQNDSAAKSDSEADESEGSDDVDLRVQRHERESWLLEQTNCDKELPLAESSPFENLTSNFKVIDDYGSQVLGASAKKCSSDNNPKRTKKRGSFLSRGNEFLAKVAEHTRPRTEGNLKGPNHSGTFVFTVDSTISGKTLNDARRRSTPSLPVHKRPRMEQQWPTVSVAEKENSIFNLL